MIDVEFAKQRIRGNPQLIKDMYALGLEPLDKDGAFNYRKFVSSCVEVIKKLHIDEYMDAVDNNDITRFSEQTLSEYHNYYLRFYMVVSRITGIVAFAEFFNYLLE